MKETELKSIIDEETYTRVKCVFDWEKVILQENHYYTDKDGLLRKKRVMVRVRTVGKKNVMQVKLHKNPGSPLQICEENEYSVDGVPESIDAKKAKEITGMDVGELLRLGSAVTERHILKRGTTELCLDKTTYFGKTDYEVELEYILNVDVELLQTLNSIGVAFDKKSVGKFSRFLREYEIRNGE